MNTKQRNYESYTADRLTGHRHDQLYRLWLQFRSQTGRPYNKLSGATKWFFMQNYWQDMPAFCAWLTKQQGKGRGHIPASLIGDVMDKYAFEASKHAYKDLTV